MTIRIANGAGFLGDSLAAPRRLAESGALDYLTLEYLAELTLSILARQREKDPATGFAADFLLVLGDLAGTWRAYPSLKLITNGGGMNPLACAARAGSVLVEAGLGEALIGVVSGDDILSRTGELRGAGCTFENLDTGQPLSELSAEIVSANAYLGARPIADALSAGARLVITGRVADVSLTLGPAVHEFGWAWDDWRRLAGASVAGHVIECGAQATGGFYTNWNELDLAGVGYPIAELNEDGSCVITHPPGSGGAVNRETISEQLVYEIGDPRHYLTPDVDVDFTTIELADQGANRVAISGATGAPPPDTYKVSLAYRAGYTASGQLLVWGRDCVAKAHECARIVAARVRQAGFELARLHTELLGAGEGVPGVAARPVGLREVVLRMTAQDPRAEAVERFAREIAPLATSGPAGLAGYAAGRPQVRPMFAYWPTLVPRSALTSRVEVRTAAEWVR